MMATNGHSGYPLKWFKDQNAARNSFECAICLEVLKDPVQIRDCGHQFCALCIDDILKTDPRCPSCRITISKAMVFEDHAARRLIKKLDVNCCNEGCNWAGNLSSLVEAHMNNCSFVVRNDCSSGSIAKHSDVEELKVKLETLVFLEEMRESELKELKLKHEKDLQKRDEELKKLKDHISFLAKFTPVPSTHAQSLQQLTLNPNVTVALEIPNFTRKLTQAKYNNSYMRIESDPFYTSHGYKMVLFVRLNEGPRGFTGYMGVYIRLVPGDHDDRLKWPFDKRITFILVDQQDWESQVQNFEKCMTPPGNAQFNRQVVESDNGRGFPQFILHYNLRNRLYVKNHTVYIAVAIEP